MLFNCLKGIILCHFYVWFTEFCVDVGIFSFFPLYSFFKACFRFLAPHIVKALDISVL